jgi:hypothetical protein
MEPMIANEDLVLDTWIEPGHDDLLHLGDLEDGDEDRETPWPGESEIPD